MEGAHWMQYLEAPAQKKGGPADRKRWRHPFHSTPLKLETLQKLPFELLLPIFQHLFLDFFGKNKQHYVSISLLKYQSHRLEFDGPTPPKAYKFQLLCQALDEWNVGSKVAAAAAEALYGCPSFVFTVSWTDYLRSFDECPLSGIGNLENFIRHLKVNIPDVKRYNGEGDHGMGLNTADWVDLDGEDAGNTSAVHNEQVQLRPLWKRLLNNRKLESVTFCIEPAYRKDWKEVLGIETRHLLPTVFRLRAKDVYVRVLYATWETSYWRGTEWWSHKVSGSYQSEKPIRFLHNLTQGFLFDRFLQRNDCCLKLSVHERLKILDFIDRNLSDGMEFGLPTSGWWMWYQYAAFRLVATERLRCLWYRLKPTQRTEFGATPTGLRSDRSWELSRGSNWVGLQPFTRD